MNTQDILNNQISAQIENRIDIEITYVQHKDIEDSIRLYEQKGLFFLGLRIHDKAISKQEYNEILSLASQDKFGNLTIYWSDKYDVFWNKYWNFRDNEKLEKVGKALFGDSWKKSTAKALNVDERRITHWLQCTRSVPEGVWSDLIKLAELRLEEINDARDLLTLSKEQLNIKLNKRIGL